MRGDRCVVIMPAHNEATVIGKSLAALLGDARSGEFDVVVVCNGCSDDTEHRAKAAAVALGHDVAVISTPVASKAAAIREAEASVTGFPRVYLDADVLCPTTTLRALVSAVRDGADLAVPTRTLDTSAGSRLASAYYRGWHALPWVQDQLAGRGAYAISRATRATFAEFPDQIADDRYVTTRVPREKSVVVPEAVVVRPPARMSEVLRVRQRIYAGNLQVDAPTHDVGRAARFAQLGATLARRPRLLPSVLVFAATTAAAKAAASLAVRRNEVNWGHADRRSPALGRGTGGRPDGPVPVDVVVVTYRSAGYVRACLEAADVALRDVPDARVIVVDNNSRDGVAEVARGASDRVDVVLRDVNDGFARGCHAGASRSTARRLLFLNPDAIVRPPAVTALLRCADEHPGAGIVGGRAVATDGSPVGRSWFGRPTLWSAVCFATGLSSVLPGHPWFDPESSDRWDGRPRRVAVVSGGLMLIEREAWDELDGFDPTFFLYGEDADLCLRAGSAGWEPRVCPEAVFQHEVGASSAGSNRLPLVMRGRVTTYRRSLPPPWGVIAGQLLVLGVGLRAVGAGARRAGGRASSGPEAWRDAWHRRSEWRDGWEPASAGAGDLRRAT